LGRFGMGLKPPLSTKCKKGTTVHYTKKRFSILSSDAVYFINKEEEWTLLDYVISDRI
jgi:hypothetical protein